MEKEIYSSKLSTLRDCMYPFLSYTDFSTRYEVYNGDKNIVRFTGDHNSERPDYFYDAVAVFFYNTLISNDPS